MLNTPGSTLDDVCIPPPIIIHDVSILAPGGSLIREINKTTRTQHVLNIPHVLQYNMPNWSFDFTESILTVNDKRLKVEELLSEYANSDLNERYAVVNGLDVDTNRPGFIRFRYG